FELMVPPRTLAFRARVRSAAVQQPGPSSHPTLRWRRADPNLHCNRIRSAFASSARRPSFGSWCLSGLLTEGSLEKPCLDGLLVVVLANHSNAIITEQQPRCLQRNLRDPRKKRLTPLIELGEEFLGTQHGAGRGMRLD